MNCINVLFEGKAQMAGFTDISGVNLKPVKYILSYEHKKSA